MGTVSTGHRIIIVGGGIAGLSLATRLARGLGRGGKADITLLDVCSSMT